MRKNIITQYIIYDLNMENQNFKENRKRMRQGLWEKEGRES